MSRVPELYGLVLAGGKSTRMGRDKGLINWYDKPQREHVADLLKSYCQQIFISCRAEQQKEIEQDGYTPLADFYKDSGPLGGILSAFKQNKDAAWLVVACDLPLIDRQHLDYLCAQRNPAVMATAFTGTDGLPEPLVTIWEPSASPVLTASLEKGLSSPRNVLLRNEITLLKPFHQMVLSNVNSRDEAEKIRKMYFKAE
ncbi:NTP transferase domain-containing protein [Pedobacter lusitanus]|nr:NTP transferase domain-containing protein [Pedobacter lusitanus]